MRADVVVIGGGVAGLTLGAELSASAEVVLFEAEEAIGYHTSGRSAALYEPTYGKPAVQALSMASGPALREAGLLSPRGVLLLGRAEEAEVFAKDAAHMGVQLQDIAEVRKRVPILSPDVTMAAGREDVYDIDTDRLLQDSARQLRKTGQILLKSRVEAITREGDLWRVTSGEKSVLAPIVVNASGAWVNHIAALAGVEAPQYQPMRRSMARIPAPGGHDVTHWPVMFGPGESWYAKPDAGALIVSPAEEFPMEPHDAWADDMVLAEGLARYQDYVEPEVERLISSWAGLRTFSPDRVLSIGADPRAKGFFWQAGQGGYGFQSAPAAARLGADLILGRPPEMEGDTIAALSPSRFA